MLDALASSYSLDSSKVRRGLVVDSWMVSIARYWNVLLSCMMTSSFRTLKGKDKRSGHTLAGSAPQGSGLAVNRLVREGFLEALQFEVFVPLGRKVFVLRVHVEQDNVVIAHNRAGPAFDAHVVVAPVIRIKG